MSEAQTRFVTASVSRPDGLWECTNAEFRSVEFRQGFVIARRKGSFLLMGMC